MPQQPADQPHAALDIASGTTILSLSPDSERLGTGGAVCSTDAPIAYRLYSAAEGDAPLLAREGFGWQLRDAHTGEICRDVLVPGLHYVLDFSPDGTLCVGVGESVYRWDARTGACLPNIVTEQFDHDAAWLADGNARVLLSTPRGGCKSGTQAAETL